jgi:hypothetical protein
VSSQWPLKVYKPSPVEGYEWLQPVSDSDYDTLTFDGSPRAASWRPVRVTRLKQWEDGSRLLPSDFPVDAGFAISRAAKEQLGSCLEEAGELLPLDCSDGDFWTLNVTRLVDALDETGSKMLRASDSGSILLIHRYRFHTERLGSEIFKLSQTPRGLIYFTDAFVNRVKATTLKGLDFKLVWAAN